ncbi:MAG: pyridoxal-phosphate dependent enzyme, partial [Saprospiraceae bacterium]|nr:pyridoxal-phosphate dependent enzyme [Saprospiraceae bacterium]
FVSAMGTTGTITGTSTYLKEKNPNIKIVGAQPTEGNRIPGIRKWSPAFLPGIYQPERVDEIIYVRTDDAQEKTRLLAEQESIMGGMSSGGALHCALEVCYKLERGVVVFIVCDRGDRYLSSELYE